MNYLNETIDSLNDKLKSGAVSADQLAKDTIANIKKTDEKINAFITVDEDAKPAEDLDFNNKLAGVPIAIKDNIITNGLKTTAASHILYNFEPVYESTYGPTPTIYLGSPSPVDQFGGFFLFVAVVVLLAIMMS